MATLRAFARDRSCAISLPMPLAAPVTMATLSCSSWCVLCVGWSAHADAAGAVRRRGSRSTAGLPSRSSGTLAASRDARASCVASRVAGVPVLVHRAARELVVLRLAFVGLASGR